MRLLRAIQVERDTDRQSFAESCVYAAQAVLATVVVLTAYRLADKPGGMWAAVSAVLILQPGFRRSLAASAIRVVANLLGVGIGALTGVLIPDRMVAVSLALVLIVLVCELGRLDMGVRSACASVLIVSIGSDPLIARGIERATAVSIGCAMALLLQFITHPMVRRFRSGIEHAGGHDGE